MTWPKIAFVDAPALTATVRLDLSTEDVYVDADDFNLGVPTQDGDPGSGVEWGYRDGLSVPVVVRGDKSAALAVLQAIARELLRSENWLLVHWSGDRVPVWFKSYRTQPGSLTLSEVEVDDPAKTAADLWTITVPLVADPFAYGSRVTLPAVTVHNDPAAGTNPCSYVLPPILGDAPAPLRISVNPSNRGTVGGYKWLHHLHASTEDASAPLTFPIGTSDGWTAGADTGAGSSDALYSGGSYRAVSFATHTDIVDRVKGNTPVTVPAGRYKVLVRIARNDYDSTFALRFGQFNFIGYVYGETVLMDRPISGAAAHATWVDLGDFTFPLFTGVPLEEAGAAAVQNIALQVGLVSGTGQARLDAIRLLPIDVAGTVESRMTVTDLPLAKIFDAAGRDVWDGETEAYWKVDNSGNAIPLARCDLTGGFLRGYPGVDNTLSLFQQVNGYGLVDDNLDVIAATTNVVVSYHPLYLNLAGDD